MTKLAKEPMVRPMRTWFTDLFDHGPLFNDEFFRNKHFPAVNIREEDNRFDIEVAAPGLKKEDFKIEVDRGLLTISAEHKETKEEKEDAYTRREFSFNSFKRTFTLPENVDLDQIDATYTDGVLTLAVKKQKIEAPLKKTIKVG